MRVTALFLALGICGLLGAGEGGLRGTVKFEGELPKAEKKLDPAKKGECHHEGFVDETWTVDPATKGLKWVIVRIMDVKAEEPDGSKLPPLKIDQKGCVFSPHVAIASPGQSVDVLNPEDIAHNFHTLPLDGSNMPINIMIPKGVPNKVVKGTKHFATPELVKYVCDIHPWMKAYVVVHDPRFAAITGADGKFEIKNVPAGKYKVIITHDAVDREREVEIKAGETTALDDLVFKMK